MIEHWESGLDDESDYKPGVNNFNIDLKGSNVDSMYDLVLMEKDGDYYVDFE